MRTTLAVQAADLLAWFSNRYWTKGNNDPWGRLYAGMFIVTPHYHVLFDTENLRGAFGPDGSLRPDATANSPSIRFPGPPDGD